MYPGKILILPLFLISLGIILPPAPDKSIKNQIGLLKSDKEANNRLVQLDLFLNAIF